MSFANSQQKSVPSSPWKKPNEIMALHRLKIKKRALQSRFSKPNTPNEQSNSFDFKNEQYNKFLEKKRRNPFTRENDCKRFKENSISTTEDASNDNTLFKLLNMSMSNDIQNVKVPEQLPNIANTITELSKSDTNEELVPNLPGYNFIPIDWTVKTKMRIISKNKFKWSSKLRTSEEASGITGFVRCLDTTTSESLDTSMSARNYQCCLVWQHPSLPWLQLFPRLNIKSTSNGPNLVATHPSAVKALHSDWVESFRSLFQLLRAKQCPYFYFCANTFTILFRAAGICGFSDIHALVTPTTRGFRQALKQEDIEYTMPLKKSRRSADHFEDLGYDTLDSTIDDSSPTSNSSVRQNDQDNSDFIVEDEGDDEDAENDQWLKSLGVDLKEIKKINDQQARKNHTMECVIDSSDESLIFVEGVEAQALFNFLLNCKSAISTVGSLAGIPPTLLSPVAFRGAALQSLKVRESKVTADDSEYYSLIVSGPILPNNIHSLADLISAPEDEYSATFENIKSTSSFSKVHAKSRGDECTENENIDGSNIFYKENLTDCGLSKKLIKHFCSNNKNHTQVIESLKFNGQEHLYYWT